MPEPTPPSPCIKVCVLDNDGYCTGCYRTILEITAWSRLSASEQRLIIGALPARARQRAVAQTIILPGDM